MNGGSTAGNSWKTMCRWLPALGLLLMAACSSARRGEPVAGPLPLPSEQVVHGRKDFLTFCDKCHPGGEAGLGVSLNNKPLPAFLISFQVRHGMGAMPSFPEDVISDRQLEDLIVYMKALRAH